MRRGLYLLAMIAGCIVYLSDYRYWFALNDYEVMAQSPIMEQRLWEIFPKRALTFWPYMYIASDGMKEFLERDIPVTVETSSTWTGKFITKIEWIPVWVKVLWRGKLWCISRDGKMWEDMPGRQNDEQAGHLVWKINELEDEEPPHIYGVFNSPISTEVIAGFLDDFRSFKWFDSIDELTWERRAGMDMFILKLSRGEQKFELQLQPNKYPGQDVGSTIEDIFTRLINEGGNHIIDATYEGKILLRKL